MRIRSSIVIQVALVFVFNSSAYAGSWKFGPEGTRVADAAASQAVTTIPAINQTNKTAISNLSSTTNTATTQTSATTPKSNSNKTALIALGAAAAGIGGMWASGMFGSRSERAGRNGASGARTPAAAATTPPAAGTGAPATPATGTGGKAPGGGADGVGASPTGDSTGAGAARRDAIVDGIIRANGGRTPAVDDRGFSSPFPAGVLASVGACYSNLNKSLSLNAPKGTKVLNMRAGKIESMNKDCPPSPGPRFNASGCFVVIKMTSGNVNSYLKYSNLAPGSIPTDFKEGRDIAAGKDLGAVGASGATHQPSGLRIEMHYGAPAGARNAHPQDPYASIPQIANVVQQSERQACPDQRRLEEARTTGSPAGPPPVPAAPAAR